MPEEAIRQRAYELWKAQGESSNSQDNWNEAKRQLEQEQAQRLKGLQKIASLLNQPLILVEKRVLEPCADWFERAAIFQILEKLSPIIEATGVLLIPLAIWWFTETNQEVKERQEKATRGQQAVQTYLNQLSNILLQGGGKKLENDYRLRNITRASTLALFQNPDLQNDLKERQSLEEDRKGQVISYLSETELIQSLKDKSNPPIISLSQSNLKGAKLEGAKLEGAKLERANLKGANLSWANLKGAYLNGANLNGAYLNGAKLEGAYLNGTNLNGDNLERANLNGAYLNGANLSWAYLNGANLSWDNLERANLKRANLKRANLKRANLKQANLSGANLSGADLSGAKLEGANLSGADLSGAKLEGADLSGAKYIDANTKPEVCEFLILESPCATKFPLRFNPIAAKMVLVKGIEPRYK
ncbi:pentapeptide repeat-containing protein [Nostoc muscorum FACHB-395]|nr:pentapeptide repeat-containing protein [Desmonostoc muscorum FACHB-395]